MFSHGLSAWLFGSAFIAVTLTPAAEVEIRPGGGGLTVLSDDQQATLKLYGYAQPTLTATVEDNTANQGWTYADFRVRRARIDFFFDYQGRTQLFLEYDGAPTAGAALVEAWTQFALVRDLHFIRAGKYVSPFSTEDMRSSRALYTVERYLALNSLFGLPATDTQLGLMLWGYSDAGHFAKYYLAVFNGNASASTNASGSAFGGNVRDNNPYKDWVARVDIHPLPSLTLGVAASYDRESAQTLRLSGLSGAAYAAQSVAGDRRAYNGDFHWTQDRAMVEGEWLWCDFTDTQAQLHGGFLMAGYWVKGDEKTHGIQALAKAEYAEIDKPEEDVFSGKSLLAFTLGANVWLNSWSRWQINAIGEYNSDPGDFSPGWVESSLRPTLLTQFQVKF